MSDDDNATLATGLVDDLKSIGIKSGYSDLKMMLEALKDAGKLSPAPPRIESN
jgi:hypothetical protein